MWIATPTDRLDIQGSDADVYQPESSYGLTQMLVGLVPGLLTALNPIVD